MAVGGAGLSPWAVWGAVSSLGLRWIWSCVGFGAALDLGLRAAWWGAVVKAHLILVLLIPI